MRNLPRRSMRSVARSRARAGFLLVEALATLAISALLLLGLASVLGLMLRATDQITARADELETTGRAIAAIRREIEAMTRARWAGEARAAFIFSGAPDKMLFTRSLPRGSGTAAVVIQSVRTNLGGRLLRAEAPLLPGAASAQDLRFGLPRNFYEGRYLIRLAYFAGPGEGPDQALEDWPSDLALPSAVRVGIVDPGTGKLLSSLRVSLTVEADPGCAAPQAAFCSHADRKKTADDTGPPGGRALGQR